MKLNMIIIVVAALLLSGTTVQTQSWSHAHEAGSARPVDMHDNCGDTYVVGNYSGANALGFTALNASEGIDAYLTKMTDSGVLWTVRAGGTGTDQFKKVISTGSNVIVYGTYSSPITFYGTSGTPFTLSGSGGFLASYNVYGAFQWAIPFIGTVEDFAFNHPVLYTIGDPVSVPDHKVALKSFSITGTGATNTINMVGTHTGYAKSGGIWLRQFRQLLFFGR